MRTIDKMLFDIGDWVIVSAQYVRAGKEPNHVVWVREPLENSQIGRVSGACRRYDGVQYHATRYAFSIEDSDGDSGRFEATKSHLFYKVCWGWLNAPLLVAPEDIQLCRPEDIGQFPLMFARQTCDMAYMSEWMRQEMANWKRDTKGRWVKHT